MVSGPLGASNCAKAPRSPVLSPRGLQLPSVFSLQVLSGWCTHKGFVLGVRGLKSCGSNELTRIGYRVVGLGEQLNQSRNLSGEEPNKSRTWSGVWVKKLRDTSVGFEGARDGVEWVGKHSCGWWFVRWWRARGARERGARWDTFASTDGIILNGLIE